MPSRKISADTEDNIYHGGEIVPYVDLTEGSTSNQNKRTTLAAIRDWIVAAAQATIQPLITERLTAPRTYYISNSGSPSNDGLTEATAFSHPDQAAAVIQRLHLNGYNVTLKLVLSAPATATTFAWTWRITAGPIGPGRIILLGDIANPELYFIDTPASLFSCLGLAIAGRAMEVRGVKLRASGAGANCIVFHNGVIGSYGDVVLESSVGAGAQLWAQENAICTQVGPVIARGTATYHKLTEHEGQFIATGATTFEGTPTYTSAVHRVARGGGQNITGATFSGAVNGKKFEIDDLTGGWLTATDLAALPGSTPGTYSSAGGWVSSNSEGGLAAYPAVPTSPWSWVFGANGNGVAGPRGIKVGDLNLGNPGGSYGGLGTNWKPTATTGAYQYISAAPAALLDFDLYGLRFRQAPSGTAGTTITWTDIWTVDLNGKTTFHETDDSTATVGDAPVDFLGGVWIRKALRLLTDLYVTGVANITGALRLAGALTDAAGANTIIGSNRHLFARSYPVASLPASGAAGEHIAGSDLPGGQGLVEWDGTTWRSMRDRPGTQKRMDWRPVPGDTALQEWGLSSADTGTPTLVSPSGTNLFTMRPRRKLVSAASANSGVGVRGDAALVVTRGNAAGLGGFRFVMEFGWEAQTANCSVFCGLVGSTAAMAATSDPNSAANINIVGVGAANAHTVLQWMTNDGSGGDAATVATLGANFPVDTSATDWYRVELWAKPNDTVIYGRCTRLNTGHTTGIVTLSTQLPDAGAFLSPQLHGSTRADTTACQLAHGDMYLETGTPF